MTWIRFLFFHELDCLKLLPPPYGFTIFARFIVWHFKRDRCWCTFDAFLFTFRQAFLFTDAVSHTPQLPNARLRHYASHHARHYRSNKHAFVPRFRQDVAAGFWYTTVFTTTARHAPGHFDGGFAEMTFCFFIEVIYLFSAYEAESCRLLARLRHFLFDFLFWFIFRIPPIRTPARFTTSRLLIDIFIFISTQYDLFWEDTPCIWWC